MITVNEIEKKGNIYIMFNEDGSSTVLNDITGVVIEKNIHGTTVRQESDSVYVSAIRGMLKYGMDNFVSTPCGTIFINPITATTENYIDMQGGLI